MNEVVGGWSVSHLPPAPPPCPLRRRHLLEYAKDALKAAGVPFRLTEFDAIV